MALVAVSPMVLSFVVRARLLGRDRALGGSMQALACVPGVTGIVLRRAFLARVLPACAATATLEFGVLLQRADARIGERVFVGPYGVIGSVDLEDDVLIGSGVRVMGGAHQHRFDDVSRPIREQAVQHGRVRIGRGAWIGAGATVMADVGAGSVVGAGAVVTRPIPENVVAAGVPARVLRKR